MDLQIRFTNTGTISIHRDHVAEILTRSLSRFAHRLKSVQLFIEDVNGPRGGLDKQCRCVLHLRRKAPIIISDYDKSLIAMLHRVADRATFALTRHMGKATKPKSKRRSGNTGEDSSIWV